MSAPLTTTTLATQNQGSGLTSIGLPPTGPPPIPPSKPVLSSPGSYKQNYINTTNINISSIGNAGTITAGIHSVNKSSSQQQHGIVGVGEKPAIAARPIPPPTLPKYSTSFGKQDRDRNEFSKLDRAEREKPRHKIARNRQRIANILSNNENAMKNLKIVCCYDVQSNVQLFESLKDGIGGSYRLASLDRLASRQRLLEQNGGYGITSIERNGNLAGIIGSSNSSMSSSGGSGAASNGYNNHNNHYNNNSSNGSTKNSISKTPSINGNNKQNGSSSGSSFVATAPIPKTTIITSTTTAMLQNKREMFFKTDSHSSPSGPPPNPPINNHVNSNSSSQNNSSVNSTPTNDKHHINNISQNNHTSTTQIMNNSSNINSVQTNGTSSTTTISSSTTPTTGGGGGNLTNVSALANNINNLTLKEKQQQLLMNNDNSSHHSDSNKIANDRYDKEKSHLQQQQQQIVRPKLKELDGYVGFANLPNQVYRKAVKKGFEFTLMAVGESGLGKSTLINSMFLSDIYNQDQHPGPSHRIKKTVAVESTKVLLKENGVNLTLTVVDTPGFGDAVDNSNCWVPIIDFIENKYEEYLTAESRVHRKATPDNRVHVCVYFIAPSGHGLKPLDVEFMQRLCDKVNIIPVIAKADTMTPEEVQLFKKQILNEIAQHKIKIYDFPDPLEDEEEAKVLRQLRTRVPFAIVGANTVIEVDGKKIRGRRYPWGIAEVENLDHCDFIALRNMVIRTHLQDLKDVTNCVHYENYRCRKLAGLGNDGKARLSNNLCPQGIMNSFMTVWNPLAQMEEEKREHDLKMKKMEAEMEQVFEMKVKEKKQKLKDSEIELTRRHEERKKALELQIRELEERRRLFEQEKKEFEDANNITIDELRRRSLEANSKETTSLTSRRVFGSLLRRHTSFGAPDGHRGGPQTAANGPNNSNSLPPNCNNPENNHE